MLSARIQYVCTAHPHLDAVGPRLTLRDGAWAYCAGRARDGHVWLRIDPTRPEFLGAMSKIKGSPAVASRRTSAGAVPSASVDDRGGASIGERSQEGDAFM